MKTYFVCLMINSFIFFAKKKLIQYPEEIRRLDYLPGFAIRGLHYDIEKGLLLKLDSFLQIQLGSVYRGLTPVRYGIGNRPGIAHLSTTLSNLYSFTVVMLR